MKRLTLTIFLALLVLGSVVYAEKTLKVDLPLDLPSFVGYAENQLIVVLKNNVAVDHARDRMSDQALANYPGFDPLLQRFAVTRSIPQFAGADRKVGGQVLAHHYKVTIGNGSVEQAKAAFERNPNVERVELIGLHTMFATPNDSYYQGYPNPDFPYDQWHYWDTKSVDADQAWDLNPGDATVVVGILDSGTRYFHLDLGGNSALWGPDNPFAGGNIFINPGEIPGDGVDNDGNGYIDDVIGYDFIETTGGAGLTCTDQDCSGKDNDPDDGNGHGTHTSGTVGAITNNDLLVAGVAGGFSNGTRSGTGNGVKIVPCRMGYNATYRGQATGIVDMAAAAEAMYYMADLVDAGHNVASINCSWGSSNSGGLGAAADFLLSRDVVIVVAAGNANSSTASYLGGRGDCLDVAATDQAGDGASFTSYGSWVDVAAPGVDILSTYSNPDDPDLTAHYISVMSGTSMSAPHVAGIVALLESCNSSLSGPDKFNLIINNTIPYNDTSDLGSGIANAYLALSAANCSGENPPVANFSGTPTSGDYPLTVSFTDLSSGSPTSWSWNFGDGVGTSTAQNPSYIYETAGTYTVSLTATNAYGSDTETKTDYITVTAPSTNPPVADFSGTPTSGDYPLTVSFTDLSTESPTLWSWDFGDGVGTSTVQNPSYIYDAAGTYTVSLTATNAYGSDDEIKVDYITVTTPQACAMHVYDIVVTRKNAGPNCSGIGSIYIYDASNQAVANATVYVTATGPVGATGSGITDANGYVGFETGKTRSCEGEWCFEVTNVTHASCSYNSGANVVTKACESGPVYRQMTATTLPNEFSLKNYPNPFNPTTTIEMNLPVASNWSISIFNIAGQKVAEYKGFSNAGLISVNWDASINASGVYFYKGEAGQYSTTQKMILMK